MDKLTFADDLVKSLAWPVVAIVMALTLRKSLVKLIPLLRKLKFKDLEAEFSEKLEQAEKSAAKVIVSPTITVDLDRIQLGAKPKDDIVLQHPIDSELVIPPEIFERYIKLLEVSPEAVVLLAWRDFEAAIRHAAIRFTLRNPKGNWLREVVEHFRLRGYLTAEQYRLYMDLNALRILAAHGSDRVISVADASRFLGLITPLTQYFQTLASSSPKVDEDRLEGTQQP